MRVVLGIDRSCPELCGHLAEMPPRQRAERLRALATIGLLVVSGRAQLLSPSMTPVGSLTTPDLGITSRIKALQRSIVRSTRDAGD
jgi:hypothetical protein